MLSVPLAPKVTSLGALDPQRRLFDALIPLPEGTSYNSYLVQGSEKTALIDTVDAAMPEVLLANLDAMGIKNLDYVIANHAEQDHSGALPRVLAKYPQAKVVTNPKCKDFLIDLLHIDADKFITVADGEKLSLGDKTLEFIYAPWVHWPETMLTYLAEDKLLFSCDFFGAHWADNGPVQDEKRAYLAAKRYFAEIMQPFRNNILQHLKKLNDKQISIIAPSHGPIHLRPEFILKAYLEWSGDKPANKVLIPFVSMHGSTASLVKTLEEFLAEKGVTVKTFDLTTVDLGELAMELVEAATMVLATPCVLAGIHPAAAYAAYLTRALRPKLKYASIIGSYGWAQKVPEQVVSLLTGLNVEILPPVMVKGLPRENDLLEIRKLGEIIVEKHKGLNS
ncbi:MAG: FprA family A-type flavoprotein [Candidatus Margulisiibacteriota bacterium]|jgi:flavorubredoxin